MTFSILGHCRRTDQVDIAYTTVTLAGGVNLLEGRASDSTLTLLDFKVSVRATRRS